MKRSLLVALAVGLLGAGTARVAHAQPARHPRLFLDDALRATWKAQAKDKGSIVANAIAVCRGTDRPGDHDHAGYMGLEWAKYLQACLVAWAVSDDDEDARRAVRFHIAMIDDLDKMGDAKGGDKAANRDSGFSIRALGPYTAVAYDWLHDAPGMTEAVRARTRQRWAAWTTWYLANGYRARSPSTNYHAGYLAAVTLIAIAQRGEAGTAGDELWTLVSDELWKKDMAKAFAPGGVLDGGDWGEGWQYGPLSVVEYSIAARAMAAQGVTVPGVRAWLDALLLRTIHARAPGGGIFVGGDTQAETANLPPNSNTYFAVLAGDASPTSKQWAAAELAPLGNKTDFPLLGALAAGANVKPVQAPRATFPTTYLAGGTGAFFARTDWSAQAIWFVSQCHATIDVDHSHPNAGNFVISRGADDVIVDPTPYGSLSTMTSNAPSVLSAHLPADYIPSQAWWSETTRYDWTAQSASGVIATRCDYADQYKFQHRPSDVPAAQRDVIVVPWGRGATAIVIDRARSGEASRPLHLRFRTTAKLEAKGKSASGTVGNSSVRISTVGASGGTPAVDREPAGSCFVDKWTRGNCAAARFAVDQWRLVVPGPSMTAIHAIDVLGKGDDAPAFGSAPQGDVNVITADGAGFAVVVGGGDSFSYTGPRGARHVIVDGPSGDRAVVTATAAGADCKITVAASGAGTAITGRPRVFTVGDACAVAADAPRVAAVATPGDPLDAGAIPPNPDAAAAGTDPVPDAAIPPVPGNPRSARTGCCGAEAAPGAPLAMTGVVAALWFALGRRRRSS